MNPIDIVRAWKDKAYRDSLSPAQRRALPAHPSGMVELDDDEIVAVAGGRPNPTLGICGATVAVCSSLGCGTRP